MSCQTGNYYSESQCYNQPSNSAWPPTPARILALVIGINEYPYSMPSLRCAVGDADVFERFLKERLNVPNENIISLRDGRASRQEILSSFKHLRDNFKYKKNEAAIIIYYAGHGAQIDKPSGPKWRDWVTSSGRIEVLCPSDIGRRTGPYSHHVIQAIPDRTISALLNQISRTKGNNITLILDCCSSAGINRGGDSEQYVIRQILNPPQIENDTDEEIWSYSTLSPPQINTDGEIWSYSTLNPSQINPDEEIWSYITRGGNFAEGFCGKLNESHILLAACGRDQFARENLDIRQGTFTYSLMKVLNENDINTLTYSSLIHKMEMPEWQTAHCEGREVDRRLFNNHTPGANNSFILARGEISSGMSSRIVLEAGAAHGVTANSRMAIYASNLLQTPGTSNPRLGYLTVTSVGHLTCIFEVPSNITQQLRPRAPSFQVYCLLECRTSQKIALYCKNKHFLKTVFNDYQKNQLQITIVEDVESCDLELTVIDRKVYFDRHRDVLVTPHIGARLSHTIDVYRTSAIREVAKSSSHFYHHLTRTGGIGLKDVWVELKLLQEEISDDSAFIPVGTNLIGTDGSATIVVDEDARFGMTIINNSNKPLYPYVFYLDPTDLTIVEWNTPPSGAGGKVDAPLPPKSRYSLGYGDGGAPPWGFRLRRGEKKDINFFKIFFCSRSTDFSSILQSSPFEAQGDGLWRHGGPAVSGEWWATKLVQVIQLRKIEKRTY